jgi:hypothetical protein
MARGRGKAIKDPRIIEGILKILILNNYNLGKTARETGVCRDTLRRWVKKGMIKNVVVDEKTCDKIQVPVIIPSQQDHNNMQLLIKKPDIIVIDFEMLDRIKKVQLSLITQIEAKIPEQRDVEKIAKTMKLLYDISTGVVPAGEEGGSAITNNYYQIIMKQIKEMQHEPTDNTINGDNPQPAG